MTPLPILRPKTILSDYEPANTVYLTRADPAGSIWLPQIPGVLDWLASGPRLIIGSLHRFIHKAAAGPVSAQLHDWAGIEDLTGRILFDEDDDCMAVAEQLSQDGSILVCQHYSPRWSDFNINWATPPSLISDLNNKAFLADYVPSHLAPKRRVIIAADLLDEIEKEQTPFVLKVGTPMSSGASLAVRVCKTPDDARDAAQFFLGVKDTDARFVIEQFYPFTKTWCANIGVYDDERRYFGAAQQILDDARKQTGNYCGASFAAPDGVRDAALAVAEASFLAGFRGLAGMDIGTTEDGALIVFDLNFRQNNCTSQVFFHDHACERIGAAVTRNCSLFSARPLQEVSLELEDLVKKGMFIPFSSFDQNLHKTAGTGSMIAGIAVGEDAADTNVIAEKLASLQ